MLSVTFGMVRSAAGASNHARRPCRTRVSFRDQFLRTLEGREDKENIKTRDVCCGDVLREKSRRLRQDMEEHVWAASPGGHLCILSALALSSAKEMALVD